MIHQTTYGKRDIKPEDHVTFSDDGICVHFVKDNVITHMYMRFEGLTDYADWLLANAAYMRSPGLSTAIARTIKKTVPTSV